MTTTDFDELYKKAIDNQNQQTNKLNEIDRRFSNMPPKCRELWINIFSNIDWNELDLQNLAEKCPQSINNIIDKQQIVAQSIDRLINMCNDWPN